MRISGTSGYSRDWMKASLIFGIALIILFITYIQTIISIVRIWWNSGTYAHGFIIVPITLYLIWERRHRLEKVLPSPTSWGLLLLICFSFLWFIADAANILFLTQLCLVAMILSLALTLLGTGFMRTAFFPMIFLFFAVPLGEELVPYMMDFTAKFTITAIKLTGIPIYSEGRYITLPSGNWEVARACSGVRYLIASVTLGCVYAYLTYRIIWKQVAFVVFAILIPILANGLRAFGIVMLGHFSDMKIAVGVDHIIYGWFFFGLVIFFMFWVGSFWRDKTDVENGQNSHSLEKNTETKTNAVSWVRMLGMGVLAILAMSLGSAVSEYTSYTPASSKPSISLPKGRAQWQGPFVDEEPWNPIYPGATILSHKVYKSVQGNVHIYIIHYVNEFQGEELISSTNSFYDPDVWHRISESTHKVRLTEGRHISVHETVMSMSDEYRILWQWYDIFGELTSNPWIGKFWEAISKLNRSTSGSTLIGITADYEQKPEEARYLLRTFMEEMSVVIIPGALLGVAK